MSVPAPSEQFVPLSADRSVLAGDTLLAIRAPSGTRLEVPIPEVSDQCVGRGHLWGVGVFWGGAAGLTRLGIGGPGFDGAGETGNPRKAPDVK